MCLQAEREGSILPAHEYPDGMKRTLTEDPEFKQALKEAISETLHENRELLLEIFAEALEDFALAEAIREGQFPEMNPHEEVFSLFRGKA